MKDLVSHFIRIAHTEILPGGNSSQPMPKETVDNSPFGWTVDETTTARNSRIALAHRKSAISRRIQAMPD
jgi:hypothetical protein